MVKANALDLWICHHFHVLPTDRRFKRLSFWQKYILFKSHTTLPSDEDLRYGAEMQRRIAKAALPVGDLKKRGYSSEQIERMKQQLIAAGWGSPDV